MGWAAVPYVLAGASTVMSVMGQQSGARNEQAQLNYQADQATADAEAERGAAQVQAQKIRKAGKATAGQARASLAASGVDVNEGTANTINAEIIKNTETDALTAILNGDYGAKRKLAQAQGFVQEGKLARNAANVKSVSSVLSTGAKVASGWKTVSQGPNLTNINDGNSMSYGNYA